MGIDLKTNNRIPKQDLLYYLHDFYNIKRVLQYVARSIEIAHLTKEEKELLYMFVFENMSYKEIAEFRGTSYEHTCELIKSIIRRVGIQMLVQMK
ncbi:hypothetical protein FPV24_00530 [Carnobacterium sp. PL24RED07]|uniref:sigma factor-like helix-turn-helix DNA-binding protein n=1 Tax=unclassified Carnobacterium TaxID=257487 RepID=UPI0011EDEEFA|nr:MULTISPECIES: sigma factor-like helix-turn-helix DNA-binding protein [unclassified Carnobacterium]KAF3303626.1 hypothetical protein FPV22_00530 [Carnobacterium sp. PL26RED25]KAF3307144.1 hypothetical protein FPV24_00530 [Carnobacterium sp. PL24RED07]